MRLSPPPQSPPVARRSFLALSRLAAVPLLAGCTTVPGPIVEVQRSFSREHFCPLARVAAVEVDRTPPAPPVIARDPERLAMWYRRFLPARGERHRFLVRGCEEGQMYSCWSFGGEGVDTRHGGRHYEPIGASCTGEAPFPTFEFIGAQD